MKTIIKLILFLGTSFLMSGMTPAVPQEIDLDMLCTRFPLNSRCHNHHSPPIKPTVRIHQFDRDTFCKEFSFNSHCQAEPLQVIKFNLERSGEDNEWIRIEKKGNIVRLVHTTKVEDVLVSEILNQALNLVPLPMSPGVNKYNWEDHRVTRVTFKSDHEASRCACVAAVGIAAVRHRHRCKLESCMTTGKKTLKLPKGTNIYQGVFTIEYQEKQLTRSISFKIPADLEVSTVNTTTITIPNNI
jgi:hypothetical protein